MSRRFILVFCMSLALIPALVLPVMPVGASGEFLEVHWDAGFQPPQETYFSPASTVYLKAGREGATDNVCTADLLNKRSGEVSTITLVDIDYTANYTGSFIPEASFSTVEHGDHIEITVYLGTETIAQRTILMDDAPPTITTAGTITLTNDIGGDGVVSIGDTITYTAGNEGTFDAVYWTVDLSAYGLSATATPGDYTLGSYDYDGSFSAVETVTDKAKNTTTGSVAVAGNLKIDLRPPVIVTPGMISLTDDADGDGIVDIGDEITYAVGVLESSDGDTWRVDLSAWGLSATTAPGAHTVTADNVTFGFTETVTDNGGNVGTGMISPSFNIKGLYVWPEVSHLGDRQYVHATVNNTSGFAGSVIAILSVNGVRVNDQTVSLAAGDSEKVEFIIRMDEVGTHTASVNGVSGTFTVEEPLLPAITPVNGDSTTLEVTPPPEPELPVPPEPPASPFTEPAEAEGPEEPVTPAPGSVNIFLLFIGALAQSIVVFYIVNVLRKKALKRPTAVRTTRDV